jgi:hypothetical protein
VLDYRKRLDGFYAAHPFWGFLLAGSFCGLFCWVAFGLWSNALNLFAFELWMGTGLLFIGPLIVVIARRKQRPPSQPDRP